MATIWVWRSFEITSPSSLPGSGGALPDITGYDVEASDGHIGKIDEATYENGQGMLVVDTGFWIFGKKRMLPASVVDRVDPDEQKAYLSVSKEQVRSAPDYEESKRDEASYRKSVGEHYEGEHYEGDPVSPRPGPDLPPE
jgi:hypothetical protein